MTIKLQMMPWCKILKSQTTIILPSSTAATSGLVSLAAPVLREKCISALRNVHNSQKSTLVNLPAVTVLQIFGIDDKKIKEGHPNPQSSSTERETIAGMFHMPCYRLISKDLKRPPLREGAQVNPVDLPAKINMGHMGKSRHWEKQISLFSSTFCALLPD